MTPQGIRHRAKRTVVAAFFYMTKTLVSGAQDYRLCRSESPFRGVRLIKEMRSNSSKFCHLIKTPLLKEGRSPEYSSFACTGEVSCVHG